MKSKEFMNIQCYISYELISKGGELHGFGVSLEPTGWKIVYTYPRCIKRGFFIKHVLLEFGLALWSVFRLYMRALWKTFGLELRGGCVCVCGTRVDGSMSQVRSKFRWLYGTWMVLCCYVALWKGGYVLGFYYVFITLWNTSGSSSVALWNP